MLIATALAFIRRIPPAAWIALASALVIIGAYHWTFDRGAHSRDGEVARITAARDTAIANTATLKAAVAHQSAAVAAMTKARDAERLR